MAKIVFPTNPVPNARVQRFRRELQYVVDYASSFPTSAAELLEAFDEDVALARTALADAVPAAPEDPEE